MNKNRKVFEGVVRRATVNDDWRPMTVRPLVVERRHCKVSSSHVTRRRHSRWYFSRLYCLSRFPVSRG